MTNPDPLETIREALEAAEAYVEHTAGEYISDTDFDRDGRLSELHASLKVKHFRDAKAALNSLPAMPAQPAVDLAAVRALKKTPLYRLGQKDIPETRYWNTAIDAVLELLEAQPAQSIDANSDLLTNSSMGKRMAIPDQPAQEIGVDIETLLPAIIENTSVPPGFTSTSYLREVLQYLASRNLLRTPAGLDADRAKALKDMPDLFGDITERPQPALAKWYWRYFQTIRAALQSPGEDERLPTRLDISGLQIVADPSVPDDLILVKTDKQAHQLFHKLFQLIGTAASADTREG